MSKRDHPSSPGDGQEREAGMTDSRSSSAADAPPQPGPPPTREQLEAELEATRQELQATFAKYQRLAADFENHRRRTRQELAERTEESNEVLLRRLLSSLDNFRAALRHGPQGIDAQWFEGIKLIAREFGATLEAQ